MLLLETMIKDIELQSILKEVIGCKTHFYMLFEQKCVLTVCTRPPYNDKNIYFFISKIPFFKSGHSQLLVSVMSH